MHSMQITRRDFLISASAITGFGLIGRDLLAATPEGRSPITNLWGKSTTKKIDVEDVEIFRGHEGQSYSHQSQLTSHDGKLFATWSLGLRDEEGPGQRMVLAISEDEGSTWTKPITIAPANPGKFADSVVISSGLRAHDGKLIAYYGEWERDQSALNSDGTRRPAPDAGKLLNSRTEARTSHDGGRTWSEPTLLFRNVVNYFGPAPTKTGRLIFGGNLAYPYSDDPSGLSGWQRTAVPGIPADYQDDYFNMHEGNKMAGVPELYTEANFYQTADGVLHMMLRNERQGLLGVTESKDNGGTWSKPMLTGYTDAICRAQFGRLPDGRYFGMNCPKPRGEKSYGHRTPAVLAISKDGVTFDQHFILGDAAEGEQRIPGLYKHGYYGYPYLHIMGDQAFMIYSCHKEDIRVSRFPLSALA